MVPKYVNAAPRAGGCACKFGLKDAKHDRNPQPALPLQPLDPGVGLPGCALRGGRTAAALSLVKQIATDVKWVMEQGIVDPILKIAAQFVIKESYHEAGNKREYSQLFPRELKKVQVSLAKAEPGSDVLRSMEEIANHPQATKNLISADFGVSFVTGLTGAVNLFSRFVPGSKRLLRDSRVSIALNGAGLVLQCVKMALDPQSLTKDQTMLMTLTIKAVDFLDSSRQLLQSSDEDEVEDKDDERPGR